MFGKFLGYIYYKEDFKNAITKAVIKETSGVLGDFSKNIFRYYNWTNPHILKEVTDINGSIISCRVYAEANDWGAQLESTCRNHLFLDKLTDDYKTYVDNIPPEFIFGIIGDKEEQLSQNGVTFKLERYIDANAKYAIEGNLN